MTNIKPISDLTNYVDVLKEVREEGWLTADEVEAKLGLQRCIKIFYLPEPLRDLLKIKETVSIQFSENTAVKVIKSISQ